MLLSVACNYLLSVYNAQSDPSPVRPSWAPADLQCPELGLCRMSRITSDLASVYPNHHPSKSETPPALYPHTSCARSDSREGSREKECAPAPIRSAGADVNVYVPRPIRKRPKVAM